MKLNKSIIAILVLSSLLLSAVGTVYYFYMKNQRIIHKSKELKTVFIAARDIAKNKKILEDDLVEMRVAKKYILSTPLFKNEIIGKIAQEKILVNEVFRKEKLSNKLNNGESDPIKFVKNSYNIDFKLFSNPNYALKRGDFISIVSVYPKSKYKENMDFKVQYVAKHIKVIGFLEDGKSVQNTFRTVRKKVKNKNKNSKAVRYENVKVFADELVLDIQSQLILDLLEDYNKGKQIWMVKTKEAKVIPQVVQKKKTEVKKKKTYVVKWYVPTNKTYSKTATIHYADTNVQAKSNKAYFETTASKACKKRANLLIGISNNVDLREKPSMRSKSLRKVHKNYLIPYIKEIDESWYQVCDGRYVHKNEAKIISYKQALKKLSWQEKQEK